MFIGDPLLICVDWLFLPNSSRLNHGYCIFWVPSWRKPTTILHVVLKVHERRIYNLLEMLHQILPVYNLELTMFYCKTKTNKKLHFNTREYYWLTRKCNKSLRKLIVVNVEGNTWIVEHQAKCFKMPQKQLLFTHI